MQKWKGRRMTCVENIGQLNFGLTLMILYNYIEKDS